MVIPWFIGVIFGKLKQGENVIKSGVLENVIKMGNGHIGGGCL